MAFDLHYLYPRLTYFDDGPDHKVGEAPDVVHGGEEAVEVEGANDCCGTCTVRFC